MPTRPDEEPRRAVAPSGEAAELDTHLCQTGGVNNNYTSSSGTLYHIQIEDRGPLLDRVTEGWVRRINLVVYANYGEPNAWILHSEDHDLPDVRTREHNDLIQQRIQQLASEARTTIEEKEQRQVMRIKCLIREYYHTKDEDRKREFELANSSSPFLFSRAWRELRAERPRTEEEAAGPAVPVSNEPPHEASVEAPPETLSDAEVRYPLEAELREAVMDIERVLAALAQDLGRLRQQGGVDDILLQTCRKLVSRAKDSISGRAPTEFNTRRLGMVRNGLTTTWRQVRSRLRGT